ncbi:HAD family phosphatase [Candidatus Peregrinibacteria bacterium]|nr:HAD family phosphatase [Candidatus Peregrinibacteria bacterium]
MKAIIFDMDGVVLDSEKHWDKEVFKLFKKWVPKWNPEKHEKVVGLNTHDLFEALDRNGIKMVEKDFAETIETIAMRIYRTRAKVMPGLIDLVKALRKKKVPIGLASSSKISWITYALKASKLASYFDFITSSEEVKEGKPDPDIYLLATKRMKVKPNQCVAIEDSAIGVKAAKSAGLFTVAFRNGTNDSQDHSPADREIRGFTKENNRKILALLE